MAGRDSFDDLEMASDGLNDSLGQTSRTAHDFRAEMEEIRKSFSEPGKVTRSLQGSLSGDLRQAFDGVIFDGEKLSDHLRSMLSGVIDVVYSASVDPVTDHFGTALGEGLGGLIKGLFPFADGASFAQGRVMPFANGGVVSGPTLFPMRGGTGLMGEAGPEAIMPLARGPDGKLGVRGGGGATQVTINVSTPDAQSFQRSQGQIAAQMSRALGRANRNR